MKGLYSKKLFIRTGALYLAFTVFLAGVPLNEVFAAPTVDIKAAGPDAVYQGESLTINDGESYTYSLTSAGATVCAVTSPFPSGSIVDGVSTPVLPGESYYYPTVGNPVTITVECNDLGTSTTTDSVVIQLASTPPPPPPPPPSPVTVSADIKANGSDGPVTITDGDSYIYTWSSTNATVCAITSPFPSGSTLNGTSTPVLAGETLYYPTLGNPVTITFTCNNNGMATATDSVIINLASTPPPPPPPSPPFCPLPSITSSLSSSVTVNQPFSYTITATSTGATSTTTNFSISGTLPAGLSFSTSTATISGTPTETGTFNLSMTAATDCGSDTDTLVITVNPAGGGGGGGGGSGGGGSSRTPGGGSSRPPSGEVLGATTSDFCPFLTGYMRIGYVNDPANVARLQVFLNIYEGSNLAVTGVFDEATFQAVEAFQLKYKDDILTPWGINQPTGYVYIRTLGKINQILCGTGIQAVTPAKVIKDIKPQVLGKEAGGYKEGAGTSTLSSVPIIGSAGSPPSKGQKFDDGGGGYVENIAAALFTWPSGGREIMKSLYELLLILIVLYILGSVLESVLYKDKLEEGKNVPENISKKFYAKWWTIAAGLLVSLGGAYYLKEWQLLMPLLVALLVVIAWILTRPAKTKEMEKETVKETKTQTIMVTEKGEKK